MRAVGSRRVIVIAFISATMLAAAAYLLWPDPQAAQSDSTNSSARSAAPPATVDGEPSRSAPVPQPGAKRPGLAAPSERTDEAAASVVSTPLSAPAPEGSAKAPYQPGPSKYKSAKNPEARALLARVGVDFEAEAFWLRSINDPSTPAKERSDLIEDLNEDGISDPAKPNAADLPLIKSRIELIERLIPSAMDKVNADAFREARKDLVNMRDKLER